MRARRSMLAAVAVLGMIAGVAPAGADEVEVTSVTAVVSPATGGLSVTGDVAFAPWSLVVAEDNQGDASSTVPGELGTDIISGTITSDPAKPNEVTFGLQLDSLPGGGIPEAVIYGWDVLVNGAAAGGGTSSDLTWKRTNVTGLAASTSPYIRLLTCAPSDTGNTCSAGSQLPGGMDMGTALLTATLRLRDLGAQPGDVIFGNGISVYHGTGMLWFPNVTSDTAFIDEEFTIPSRAGSVKLAIVPSGAPAPASFPVSVTPSGTGDSGSYSAVLPTSGLASGAYDVITRACWGGSCGTTRTPVDL
jgi:hypothetical protein